MEIVSRHRWRISIASAITLLALILSLAFAFALRVQTHAAGAPLTQISSDPFTNPDSNHKTQLSLTPLPLATQSFQPSNQAASSTVGPPTSVLRLLPTGAQPGHMASYLMPQPTQCRQTRRISVPVTPRWPTTRNTKSG